MVIRTLASLLVIVSSLAVLLVGCTKTDINGGISNMAIKAAIPLIDASDPVKVETATFALG
ncbi:hypothetical protein ACFLWU_01780 [Chloroflexota bacterium]